MKSIVFSILFGASFLSFGVFALFGGFAGFPAAQAQSIGTNPAIDIVPAVLPDGMVGTAYSQALTATAAASGPFYWTLTAGNPPPGLALSTATTSSSIVLSGIPASAGQFTFTISVTNHDIAATRTFVMNVAATGITGATSTMPSINTTTSTAATTTTTALTLADIEAQLAAAAAELQKIAATLTLTGKTGVVAGATNCGAAIFCRDLTVGDTGPDVLALQQFLNSHGATLAASGPGSPGLETEYFGELTRAALARWQTMNDIFPANGYFGAQTRAIIEGLAEAPGGSAATANLSTNTLGTSGTLGAPATTTNTTSHGTMTTPTTTTTTTAPTSTPPGFIPSPSQSQSY